MVYVADPDGGAAAIAKEFGFKFSPNLVKDKGGYDRLDSLVKEGERLASSDVVMLLNADCFLGPLFFFRLV